MVQRNVQRKRKHVAKRRDRDRHAARTVKWSSRQEEASVVEEDEQQELEDRMRAWSRLLDEMLFEFRSGGSGFDAWTRFNSRLSRFYRAVERERWRFADVPGRFAIISQDPYINVSWTVRGHVGLGFQEDIHLEPYRSGLICHRYPGDYDLDA